MGVSCCIYFLHRRFCFIYKCHVDEIVVLDHAVSTRIRVHCAHLRARTPQYRMCKLISLLAEFHELAAPALVDGGVVSRLRTIMTANASDKNAISLAMSALSHICNSSAAAGRDIMETPFLQLICGAMDAHAAASPTCAYSGIRLFGLIMEQDARYMPSLLDSQVPRRVLNALRAHNSEQQIQVSV